MRGLKGESRSPGSHGHRARFRPICRSLAVSLTFVFGIQSTSADLEVQATNGLVTVRAGAAPLAEVLDRLSRETGMKLVYEDGRPSQLITVTIEGLSEAEAVTRILEGRGLSYYLFQMDTSGRHVEILIIKGTSGSGAPAVPSRAPSTAGGFEGQPLKPAYSSPPGRSPLDLGAPSFPVPASNPTPPGAAVPPPQFPRDASNPPTRY